MASLHQKRPSISNWFSSLRRQPKNKKSSSGLGGSGSFGSKQQLQRSCFDLSSTVGLGSGGVDVGVGIGYSIPGSPGSRSNSTFYISPSPGVKEDKRRLLVENGSSGSSGSSLSSVCTRCFCNLLTKTNETSKPKAPTLLLDSPKIAQKPPAKPRSPSLAPYTSVATYNITSLSPDSPPPASPTLSTETVSCSDVSHKVTEVQRLPCDEPNTELFSKRVEFKHTTTTTTTRTLIVSRPVELLLNEKGEIIAKRTPRKTRSNSLGCMLDTLDTEAETDTETGREVLGMDNPGLQLDTDPSSGLSSPSPLTPDAGDLRFIDDSSNSQSESERNSLSQNQHKNNNNNNSNINNNNNSNGSSKRSSQQSNLCESCRTLLERNRSNAEQRESNVILRRPGKVCRESVAYIGGIESIHINTLTKQEYNSLECGDVAIEFRLKTHIYKDLFYLVR